MVAASGKGLQLDGQVVYVGGGGGGGGRGAPIGKEGERTINFAGQFIFQIQCNISNNSAQIITISRYRLYVYVNIRSKLTS